MNQTTSLLPARDRGTDWLAPIAACAALAIVALLRMTVLSHQTTRIGYGIVLVAFLWLRNVRWLWVVYAITLVLAAFETFYLHPGRATHQATTLDHDLIDLFLAAFNLTVITSAIHVAITSRGSLELANRDLVDANSRLSAREEEIARQNTRLQLQAVELEQHSEQLKLSNAELAARAGMLKAVLRATPVGVIVSNADCTDVRLNPAGGALLGVAPDTNVVEFRTSPPWHSFVGGQPLLREQSPLLRAAAGDEVHGLEVEVVLPTGRRIMVLSQASPVRDPAGTIMGAVGAFADITPQKELQRELDTRRREAEEASVRKTRFLAAISHDIRTPANAIVLLAELLRRAATTPAMSDEIPELVNDLRASSESLVALLSDVLDVARFDSDKVDLQESVFSLASLLLDEGQQLTPLARQKELELRIEPADPAILLRTDRIKLSRVLGNLIGNAIKFTDKGWVSLSALQLEGGGLAISVSDSGIGISPEDVKHIFDEFFQLRNPERDRNKGSGLGLTICKRLVDAMGGRIEVRGMLGAGSTFIVTFPSSVVVANRVH